MIIWSCHLSDFISFYPPTDLITNSAPCWPLFSVSLLPGFAVLHSGHYHLTHTDTYLHTDIYVLVRFFFVFCLLLSVITH